jgi:hypothetical protein
MSDRSPETLKRNLSLRYIATHAPTPEYLGDAVVPFAQTVVETGIAHLLRQPTRRTSYRFAPDKAHGLPPRLNPETLVPTLGCAVPGSRTPTPLLLRWRKWRLNTNLVRQGGELWVGALLEASRELLPDIPPAETTEYDALVQKLAQHPEHQAAAPRNAADLAASAAILLNEFFDEIAPGIQTEAFKVPAPEPGETWKR